VANNCGDSGGTLIDEQMLGISATGVGGVGAEGNLLTKQEQVLKETERMNGRIAMLLIGGTLLVELLSGNSVMHLFGM
jgi:hypothetical protein